MADVAGNPKTLSTRLIVFSTAILFVSLFVVSYFASQVFEAESVPELNRKAAQVAATISGELSRALSFDIPIAELRGVPDFLEESIAPHSEIEYAAVSAPDGRVLYAAGAIDQATLPTESGVTIPALEAINTISPLALDGTVVGLLHLGSDPDFVAEQQKEILFDVVTTAFVAILITFEVVLVLVSLLVRMPLDSLSTVIGLRGDRPVFDRVAGMRTRGDVRRLVDTINTAIELLNARARSLSARMAAAAGSGVAAGRQTLEDGAAALNRLSDAFSPDHRPRPHTDNPHLFVRLPVFMFFFAAELPRSFLPIYADALYVPLGDIPREIAIALPISAFLAVAAVLTPMAGFLINRLGSRTLFLLGVIPSVLGFVMIGRAADIMDLVLWRCVNAVGFAFISMASIGYIADVTERANRARGMATYLAAYVAAGVCGTAVGAILADRIGFGPVFYLSGGLALLSAITLYATLPRGGPRPVVDQGGPVTFATLRAILLNRSLLMLLFFAAVPAQIVTMGGLFFLQPLLLQDLDNTQSEIGRVIMLYFLVIIFAGHFAASWADRLNAHRAFVVFGCAFAGLGFVALAWEPTTLVAAIAALCLGLSAAALQPAQGAVLIDLSRRILGGSSPALTIGMFRVGERIGGVIGPALASFLAFRYGAADAAAMIGAGVLAAAVVYGLYVALSRSDALPGRRGLLSTDAAAADGDG
ncbi:MAG: MFS transporter [Pseudomonadota bacterium]